MTQTMNDRLFMICTGMLYFGAMLSGLAGYGWSLVPFFVGVFFVWLVMMKPETYPTRFADWLHPDVLLNSALRLAVQFALVVFCFALGRGVGGVTGMLPALPVALTLGLSFFALPAARLLRPGANPNAVA